MSLGVRNSSIATSVQSLAATCVGPSAAEQGNHSLGEEKQNKNKFVNKVTIKRAVASSVRPAARSEYTRIKSSFCQHPGRRWIVLM